MPDVTSEEAPRGARFLFVPGAVSGTLAAMKDPETIEFVASRGVRARHVTSICMGSLILGQAGLLEGRRATSHWLALPQHLALFGATPVDERVVRDGSLFTGGGVTAGLDFGLSLVAQLRGEDYARAVQLLAEQAPEPPLDAGTLVSAPPETSRIMQAMFAGFGPHVEAVAEGRSRGRSRARLGWDGPPAARWPTGRRQPARSGRSRRGHGSGCHGLATGTAGPATFGSRAAAGGAAAARTAMPGFRPPSRGPTICVVRLGCRPLPVSPHDARVGSVIVSATSRAPDARRAIAADVALGWRSIMRRTLGGPGSM